MAGRRGNNEGTITRRADGRWEARSTLKGGKRQRFYGKTRQEVSRLLAMAVRDRESGLPLVGEKQTVEHYLVSWLETSRHTVRLRTWKRYAEYVRLHIVP